MRLCWLGIHKWKLEHTLAVKKYRPYFGLRYDGIEYIYRCKKCGKIGRSEIPLHKKDQKHYKQERK